MTPNAALALAATAATAIAVGVVVAVPSDGAHDSRTAATAATTGGAATPGVTDSGSGSGGPSDSYSGASGSPSNSASANGSAAGHTATSPTRPPVPATTPGAGAGLDDPRKKEIAMEIVSSAENSSLDWRAQYKYIQDINDGRGYTGGIIGFCSGTGDMVQLVQHYTSLEPNNVLAKYLGALKADVGSTTHQGLDPNFTKDWATAAGDPLFQRAQDDERDRVYFNPAVDQAKADGLRTLGQFIYYDALVMHGPGSEPLSFGGIRAVALRRAKPPSQGGDEVTYLNAFLDARIAAMKADPSHQDTSRVDTEQRLFVKAGNLDLNTSLHWWTYGDPYTIN